MAEFIVSKYKIGDIVTLKSGEVLRITAIRDRAHYTKAAYSAVEVRKGKRPGKERLFIEADAS